MLLGMSYLIRNTSIIVGRQHCARINWQQPQYKNCSVLVKDEVSAMTQMTKNPKVSLECNQSVTNVEPINDQIPAPSDSVEDDRTTFKSLFNSLYQNWQAEYYSYPTPILFKDLYNRYVYYSVFKKKVYHWAVLAVGVSNFMSYAAHFCKHEATKGSVEIVSVGAGNGFVDNEIIAAYRDHFGDELRITPVDPKPEYKYDFKTVDDLIQRRPNVVGNCIVMIIWPELSDNNDGYDIEAVRKLQPLAVLTAYETTGISGSEDFRAFMRVKGQDKYDDWRWRHYKDTNLGLDNYKVEEVVYQRIITGSPNEEVEAFGIKLPITPGECAFKLRMARWKRTD